MNMLVDDYRECSRYSSISEDALHGWFQLSGHLKWSHGHAKITYAVCVQWYKGMLFLLVILHLRLPDGFLLEVLPFRSLKGKI